jgi:hypothetical protein
MLVESQPATAEFFVLFDSSENEAFCNDLPQPCIRLKMTCRSKFVGVGFRGCACDTFPSHLCQLGVPLPPLLLTQTLDSVGPLIFVSPPENRIHSVRIRRLFFLGGLASERRNCLSRSNKTANASSPDAPQKRFHGKSLLRRFLSGIFHPKEAAQSQVSRAPSSQSSTSSQSRLFLGPQ